jgi:hypothetical protein
LSHKTTQEILLHFKACFQLAKDPLVDLGQFLSDELIYRFLVNYEKAKIRPPPAAIGGCYESFT